MAKSQCAVGYSIQRQSNLLAGTVKMNSRSSHRTKHLRVFPKLRFKSQSDLSPSTADKSEAVNSASSTYRAQKFSWRGKEFPSPNYKPALTRKRKALSVNVSVASVPSLAREELSGAVGEQPVICYALGVELSPLPIAAVSRIRKQVISEMLSASLEDVRMRFHQLREEEGLAAAKQPSSQYARQKRALVSRSQYSNVYYQAAALPLKSKRSLKLRLESVLPRTSVYTRLSVFD
jgi:hypothetical protein